jgi:alpha-ketoglutarate-dependent taurine dioxygenase
MKVTDLGNAVEVTDIDLYNDDECKELGKLVAQECVVSVPQKIPVQRLHDIQLQWGDPSRGFIHNAVVDGTLKGKHWRDIYLYLGYIAKSVKGLSDTMSLVSFERTKKNRPTGLFSTGKLIWHCDQQSMVQKQRIIGLMSIHDSADTQTTFMRTSDLYDSLNVEDRTMVDELTTVWEWGGRVYDRDPKDPVELMSSKLASLPIDGIESPLVETTATGRKGMRFPNYMFGHFKGMSKEESVKFRDYLWKKLNTPKYIYTKDWQDGQIMFMDQNITLHARPTDVQEGMKRTMVRNCTYVNKLFEDQDPIQYILIDGKKIPYDEFLDIVDEIKLKEYDSRDSKNSIWLKP